MEPILRSFSPDLIIVAAGFDAVEGDALGCCHVSPQCYGHMAQRLQQLAAGGKIVVALEGGYNIRWGAAGARLFIDYIYIQVSGCCT